MSAVPVRKVAALIVGLAILIPLILLMFIGPASRGTPHQVPIGLAGPGPAVAQATGMLEQAQPGAFEVHRYDDAAALEAATGHREVYGGLALGPDPVTVVATGASPVVAGALTQIGARSSGPQTRVLDVAPPAESDPRGAGFGSMVLPVFLTGAALGVALTQLLRRVPLIAIALPIGAAAVGATSIGVAMLAGVLPGAFWAQWLAMSAGIFSIAAMVAGLVSLIGLAGMGVAALLFMLVGMPLSGIAMPPEYLPWIWGEVGQWFPLGATASALRGAAFFPDGTFGGTGTGAAYAALAMWIVIGYLLLVLTVLKRRRLTADVLVPQSEPVAA